MTTKHTPAPWEARYIRLCHRDSPDMSGKPYQHSYEFRVDFFSKVDIDSEEGKANAKLIAAAPDLLEALIENLTHLDETIDGLSSVGLGTNNTAIQDLADRTRAAIEKVTNWC